MGNEILELLNDGAAVKILVTADETGAPHPVVKDSLRFEDGKIIYFEFCEASRSNRNMTNALWFDKKAVILLFVSDKRSFNITAKPARCVVNTKLFQRYYEEAREKYGFDLSSAWILEPLEITEHSLGFRVEQESRARSYFNHLDRLAGKEVTA
jgi:hypothetical protein